MAEYGDLINNAVAAELRAERARKQITVQKLADEAELSKSAVLHYLNGQRTIPIASFIEICRAIEVSPVTIMERAENSVK